MLQVFIAVSTEPLTRDDFFEAQTSSRGYIVITDTAKVLSLIPCPARQSFEQGRRDLGGVRAGAHGLPQREFVGRSAVSGENACLAIVRELADVPIRERGRRVDSIVLFLNRWSCHFPTKTDETRRAMGDWLDREHESLESLTPLTKLQL